MEIDEKRRARIIDGIQKVIHHHNQTCSSPAKVVIMHPTDWESANISVIDGVLVGPDKRARPGFFRVLCEASGWELQQALEEIVSQPVEAPKVPQTV